MRLGACQQVCPVGLWRGQAAVFGLMERKMGENAFVGLKNSIGLARILCGFLR